MTLHVLNPEYDIALAYDNKYLTAPYASRQLRDDLDYLPILWAEEGNYVLVENASSAWQHASHLQCYGKQANFVDKRSADCLSEQTDKVVSWGWDSSTKPQLGQTGIKPSVLPDNKVLAGVRRPNDHQSSPAVLKELQENLIHPILLGESSYVGSLAELETILQSLGKVVIKAPWSSSGRGVRCAGIVSDVALTNWSKNVIEAQGGIIIESYYNKMKDLGIEFCANENGAHYAGLSIFHTVNGAYVGNSLVDEAEEHSTLSTYISNELLHGAIPSLEQPLANHLRGAYSGPLGADMTIIAIGDSFMLHPVAEINLRRTMGYVALSLPIRKESHNRTMRIGYDGFRYHLHIVHKDR